MKGRKRGCFLPLTFILLFVCVTGHATDDSDDGEEEDVLGVPLPPLKLGHSDCALKADEGPCKAIHMRFYFNIRSRECEIFEYGGCHGNANNYLTLEECQNKCVVTGQYPFSSSTSSSNLSSTNLLNFVKFWLICNQKIEKKFKYDMELFLVCFENILNTCSAISKNRYFYNKETKICEIFKYGGCLGNQNNFKSLEECQTTCEGNSNLLSVVPDEEHPNRMNSSSPQEEHNQFPGIVDSLSLTISPPSSPTPFFFPLLVNLLPTAPNEEESHTVNSSYPEEEPKQFPSSFGKNLLLQF
ncbi:hypothetical protein CIB84_001399 [Bambusicola thoracicus]|uniref:BPTI/Kunitz inhibitor domain-containing protein n=1 Tax=Bambusicola thoracicus TaxID=9083 RepID=A0A2P4TER4_BAMTH|nr:hypothetical protein CIB84_001399 [Bambusicola thoracicus]